MHQYASLQYLKHCHHIFLWWFSDLFYLLFFVTKSIFTVHAWSPFTFIIEKNTWSILFNILHGRKKVIWVLKG